MLRTREEQALQASRCSHDKRRCARCACVKGALAGGAVRAGRGATVTVWERRIQAIGPVPNTQHWISGGDRGSDLSTVWQTCEP
jgi:hypothetical protein